MLGELSKYLLSSEEVDSKITSISSTPKKNPSLDSFFKSNLNKTLVFDSWKIKNNGNTLIRMIDGKESTLITSYMVMNGSVTDGIITKYIYYMINGHVFYLSLLRDLHNKLTICIGDYISEKTLAWQYSKYEWED